ncbi:MAG: four helix bundle protein [Chloroflexi bacterium]|nr:four helix bundle protein [Chloroflexota bacterium]
MEQTQEKVTARNYQDLIVWQNAIKLAKEIYKLTEKFPRHETYALADQIRRAVVSVPSNIAEGQARKAPADFRRFLHIALGSLAEVDTQLILAQEFNYLSKEDVDGMDGQIQELRKKLYALMNSLPAR